MKKNIIASSLFIFLLSSLLFPGCNNTDIPKPQVYLNDFAKIIPDEVKTSLEFALSSFELQTNNEMFIVTVNSLRGKSIEDYTLRLMEKWSVGQKRGLIFLVADKEKEVIIEVGDELDSKLPNARVRQIIDIEILPRLKQGDFNRGIQEGTEAIVDSFNVWFTPYYYSEDLYIREWFKEFWGSILLIFGIILLFCFLIWLVSQIGIVHKSSSSEVTKNIVQSTDEMMVGRFRQGHIFNSIIWLARRIERTPASLFHRKSYGNQRKTKINQSK